VETTHALPLLPSYQNFLTFGPFPGAQFYNLVLFSALSLSIQPPACPLFFVNFPTSLSMAVTDTPFGFQRLFCSPTLFFPKLAIEPSPPQPTTFPLLLAAQIPFCRHSHSGTRDTPRPYPPFGQSLDTPFLPLSVLSPDPPRQGFSAFSPNGCCSFASTLFL